MIVEAKQIDKDGTMAYRSFAFGLTTKSKRHRGFPSLARDLETLRMSQDRPGDVRSDYLRPDTSAIPNNIDLDDAFSDPASPQPDRFCGDQKFCSLAQVARHAGADPGLAIHAHSRGYLGKPDAFGFGQTDPLWKAGKSAKAASLRLQAVKEIAAENK
jgi:hypothetical protein